MRSLLLMILLSMTTVPAFSASLEGYHYIETDDSYSGQFLRSLGLGHYVYVSNKQYMFKWFFEQDGQRIVLKTGYSYGVLTPRAFVTYLQDTHEPIIWLEGFYGSTAYGYTLEGLSASKVSYSNKNPTSSENLESLGMVLEPPRSSSSSGVIEIPIDFVALAVDGVVLMGAVILGGGVCLLLASAIKLGFSAISISFRGKVVGPGRK